MPTAVPEMSLSHGQVLWALARGRQPEATMVDEVRYLRQLGVPFRPAELGRGRGNRLRYRYEHLIEFGGGAVRAASRHEAARDRDAAGWKSEALA